MNISLNFSEAEKGKLKEFLAGFPALKKGTAFEELRVDINGCIATLYNSGKLLLQGKNAEKTRDFIIHNAGLLGETLLGIDETGRGENYGPFVVAGVLGNTNDLREVRDSKKTGNLERAKKAVLRHSKGHLVLQRKAAEIDRLRGNGINMNEIEAEMIREIVQNFREKGHDGRILVDGKPFNTGLDCLDFQVKADDLNPVVGAASILAKTARNESADKEQRKSWKNRAEKP